MPQYFLLLSGEHPSLPFAEVEAILEAEKIPYRKRQKTRQVLRLNTTATAIEALKTRSAFTRVLCQELFCCKASTGEITNSIRSAPLEQFLSSGDSFAVRVRRIGKRTGGFTSVGLEKIVGGAILDKVKRTKVNLSSPEKVFFGTITSGYFVFGLKLAEVSPTPFRERRPRKKPFFHPSAMRAKLARCMVNLVKPIAGDLLLDPFCGTGSLLIEGGLIGCRVVGFDADKRMVKGSMRNLKFFNVECDGLAVADVKNLPISKANCIVTDPPYGRSASTMGYETKEIIHDFLKTAIQSLDKGQSICLAAPITSNIKLIAQKVGLTHVQSHLLYVHRSLTREITVLEKS